MKDHDPEKTIVNPDQFLRHRPKSDVQGALLFSSVFFVENGLDVSPSHKYARQIKSFPSKDFGLIKTQKHIIQKSVTIRHIHRASKTNKNISWYIYYMQEFLYTLRIPKDPQKGLNL